MILGRYGKMGLCLAGLGCSMGACVLVGCFAGLTDVYRSWCVLRLDDYQDGFVKGLSKSCVSSESAITSMRYEFNLVYLSAGPFLRTCSCSTADFVPELLGGIGRHCKTCLTCLGHSKWFSTSSMHLTVKCCVQCRPRQCCNEFAEPGLSKLLCFEFSPLCFFNPTCILTFCLTFYYLAEILTFFWQSSDILFHILFGILS